MAHSYIPRKEDEKEPQPGPALARNDSKNLRVSFRAGPPPGLEEEVSHVEENAERLLHEEEQESSNNAFLTNNTSGSSESTGGSRKKAAALNAVRRTANAVRFAVRTKGILRRHGGSSSRAEEGSSLLPDIHEGDEFRRKMHERDGDDEHDDDIYSSRPRGQRLASTDSWQNDKNDIKSALNEKSGSWQNEKSWRNVDRLAEDLDWRRHVSGARTLGAYEFAQRARSPNNDNHNASAESAPDPNLVRFSSSGKAYYERLQRWSTQGPPRRNRESDFEDTIGDIIPQEPADMQRSPRYDKKEGVRRSRSTGTRSTGAVFGTRGREDHLAESNLTRSPTAPSKPYSMSARSSSRRLRMAPREGEEDQEERLLAEEAGPRRISQHQQSSLQPQQQHSENQFSELANEIHTATGGDWSSIMALAWAALPQNQKGGAHHNTGYHHHHTPPIPPPGGSQGYTDHHHHHHHSQAAAWNHHHHNLAAYHQQSSVNTGGGPPPPPTLMQQQQQHQALNAHWGSQGHPAMNNAYALPPQGGPGLPQGPIHGYNHHGYSTTPFHPPPSYGSYARPPPPPVYGGSIGQPTGWHPAAHAWGNHSPAGNGVNTVPTSASYGGAPVLHHHLDTPPHKVPAGSPAGSSSSHKHVTQQQKVQHGAPVPPSTQGGGLRRGHDRHTASQQHLSQPGFNKLAS